MAWKSRPISVVLDDVFAALSERSEDIVWLDSALGDPTLGQRSLLALELAPWFSLPAPGPVAAAHEGPWSPLWEALDARLEDYRRRNEGVPTGIVGYIAYEAGYLADRAMPIPERFAPVPLMHFVEVRVGLIATSAGVELVVCADSREACEALLDEWTDRLLAVRTAPEPTLPAFELLRDEDEARHKRRVEETLEAIVSGRIYQGCMTYPLRFSRPKPMSELFRSLRRRAPADFCAFLRVGDLELASTSPERFFEIDEDRWITARPMKGTRRRSPDLDAEAEAALRQELHTSPKDRAENVMIVDLMRNDIGRVAAVNSIHVPELYEVEVYANVLQMTSTVRGRLEPSVGPFQAARALFPPGSMTGAPKLEACAVIQELEAGPRGVYSGAIAWIDGDGRSTFSVVIRALQAWADVATWNVGGGVVWGSNPEGEWDETRAKAATILGALPQK